MMLWRRLGYLLPWRRRAAERDMQEELQSIADMADPRELGNLTLAAENARAEWGWTRLEQSLQDLRYAIRTLGRNPGFTSAAVLSLAIGIGANTALFTLIDTVMWKLLPVRDPETLLALGQQYRTRLSNGFTYQQYELIRDHTQVMDLAAYSGVRLNVTIDGTIEPTVNGALVTGDYFPLLGVRPAVGRVFAREDDRVPAGHPVVVLSDQCWKRRFGGDPAVLGKQISISGVPFDIVGVTPPEFFGAEVGTAPQLYVPVMMQPTVMPMTVNLLDRPNVYSDWLRVLGRLKPGVSSGQAAARLDALAGVPETDWRPRNKFTGEVEDVRLVVSSAATGLSELRRQFSQPLFILLGATGIVLLISCANVGNLVLARSATRRHEFALRLALGAGRSRLMRQVFVEGFVLSAFAGLAGIALAWWATQTLVAYASVGQGAVVLNLSPDLRVLAFTAVMSMLAALLFSSVPALRASRVDVSPYCRRDFVRTRPASGPGRALVIVQVALSLVLLVGAGLFVRTLQNLNRHDADVDQSRVLVVRVEPRGGTIRSDVSGAGREDREPPRRSICKPRAVFAACAQWVWISIRNGVWWRAAHGPGAHRVPALLCDHGHPCGARARFQRGRFAARCSVRRAGQRGIRAGIHPWERAAGYQPRLDAEPGAIIDTVGPPHDDHWRGKGLALPEPQGSDTAHCLPDVPSGQHRFRADGPARPNDARYRRHSETRP
jgi:putative ABC transport system permease protein